MTGHLVFGARTLSIDEVKARVAPVVDDVTFELHESDMMGGDYWLGRGPESETWQIQLNQPEDDEPENFIEPDHPDFPVLLVVSLTERADDVRALLDPVDGLDFLRRKD